MKKLIFSILALAILVIACKKDDDNSESAITTFHNNYYNENIYPALTTFKAQVELQVSLSETFQTTPTKENFISLQNQWLATTEAFAKVRPYNVLAVKSLFYDIIIYNFPVTPSVIETNIEEQTTYDATYFSTKSTVSKGLGALEYLLYNEQDEATALSLLQNDTFRVDYLLGVTTEVLNQTNNLVDFWELNYKNTFINLTDVSCTENARCLAFNQLINVIDVIRVTKLGKPSGLESSSSATVTDLEAYRSGQSLNLIKSELEEVQNAYALSSANFANIVDDIAGNTELSDNIDASFTNIFTYINNIDSSLYDAILNNDENVELLYNELYTLVVYFSVDGASTLSISVLATDNDGD
ncbi:imelysin family protein [Neotamlana laminarinivorans]|uniref:Imelysin family protein n=1 Tax=Neotamlana laminarinivorans TaxID=2883124 RepID=A0A9X1I3F7_9FLAO|nr:imelysin family protein [Tamlana laminarinivorans]MCB4799953.1 imelysin family protein [Tamlana laminarinivorans]